MSEDKKYTVDPDTGLPEVPEDYFFRVVDVKKFLPRDRLGSYVERMVPLLRLIKITTERKSRMVPVRGDKWFNSFFVVGFREEFFETLEEEVVASKLFEGFRSEEAKTPEFAINIKKDDWVDDRVTYDVPVTKETIAWIAGSVWEGYLEVLDWEAQQAADKAAEEAREKTLRDQADKARDELYGDYPPKSVL